MTCPGLLHLTALLLVQALAGGFAGAGSETMTLEEGGDLTLHCPLHSEDGSARQWLDPRGFAIFLNRQRALRDQRYKLLQYSRDEFSIQLSNTTVHDEGVYKCFYYGTPFKSTSRTIEVLAAPSKPVLKVSQGTERGMTLSCYTQGCKPQPQLTWLLDNGMELPGDTQHELEGDGKKWSTSSSLTVLAHGANSTASCIVQHPALRGEKLMASFRFGDLPRTVTKPNPTPAEPEVDTLVSKNEQSTVTAPVSDLSSSSTASAPGYPQHPGSEQPTTSAAAPEDPVVPSSASTPTQHHLQPDVTSAWTEAALNGNGTEEELSTTQTPRPMENGTVISATTFEQDQKSEGINKTESNVLLPVLVAILILVLLIIVLLFMRKLKKAHGAWKRENDVSEQTLESYKSKSNEESPGQEKNGQAVTQNSNIKYITKGYVETTQKNPNPQITAISKELFVCGRETDV